jgi:hypothetical protein
MRWVESIRLQAVGPGGRTVKEELAQLTHSVRQDRGWRGLLGVMLCSHASVPGLFAVALLWETESPHREGSVLGQGLVQALKEFGMVNHVVWIAEESDDHPATM